jgi:hypothetical protein
LKLRRKLLLLLLLLLPPLQGLAAVLTQMHNALHAPAVAAMPCHESMAPAPTHAADSSVPESVRESVRDYGGSTRHGSDIANHLCCHQPCTGTTVHAPASPAQKFSDVSRLVLPLTTLFIPDAPDRPPRA